MDAATKTGFRLVEKLGTLVDANPIGVASTYFTLHGLLEELVDRLGNKLGETLVDTVAEIRRKIGCSIGEDYQSKLKEYRLRQDEDYFSQRGFVASQLLNDLRPEPFKAENDLTLEQLQWIIPSLNEANIDGRYAPELKEAQALESALAGHPTTKSECKFLSIQDIALARLIDYVPVSSLLGYWQSLTPTTKAGKRYHADIEDVLINMPTQEVPETVYIEHSLLMLEALAETVCASSRDWETRAISQQTTEYLSSACDASVDRIRAIVSSSRADLSDWENRCNGIISRVRALPKMIPETICKHFELNPLELSAYADNFDAFDIAIPALIGIASC